MTGISHTFIYSTETMTDLVSVKAGRAKTQRALVIGEEVYFLSGKNEWQIGTVTDQGFLVTPPRTCGFLHEPFHGLDLSLNEAITPWVVW